MLIARFKTIQKISAVIPTKACGSNKGQNHKAVLIIRMVQGCVFTCRMFENLYELGKLKNSIISKFKYKDTIELKKLKHKILLSVKI